MTVKIICADVMDGLAQLADESVHCIVTSPPYFGLRDYGTGTWQGGDPDCDHTSATKHQKPGATSARADRASTEAQRNETFRDTCGRCGAVRIDTQVGLEPTPAEYVDRMVTIFREARRVLRSDGVLMLNLGDSYCNTDKWGGGGGTKGPGKQTVAEDGSVPSWARKQRKPEKIPGLKPKDLIGIPWRVAFALQADGWWLRGDYIWRKPNPMPESVTDRCTKAHEYIFHLTKSPRYFWDNEAIKELALWPDGPNSPESIASPHGQGFTRRATAFDEAARPRHKYVDQYENDETELHRTKAGLMKVADIAYERRNKRSVWTMATVPFKEAHFATFPPELPEICIKAGCPEGGTVLDIFGGAGTTGMVADRLGRDAILIELSPKYAAMAKKRLARDRLERKKGSMEDVASAELEPTPLGL